MKWNSFWPPEPIISSWSPEIKKIIRNHKTEGTGRNDPIMVFCQVYVSFFYFLFLQQSEIQDGHHDGYDKLTYNIAE